jgi:cytochrome b6-f complex iron-sulfur subunit
VKRKNFINLLLTGGLIGWLGSVLYPVISFLKSPKVPEANVMNVKAGKPGDIPPNSGRIVKFGRKPVILIRKETGEFVALSATCTHLDCIVQYRSDTRQIWCACHNGVYDLKGRNVSGPPPKPLEEFAVQVINDEIVISKS